MIDTAFPKPSRIKLGGDEYKKFIESIFTRIAGCAESAAPGNPSHRTI